MKRILIALVCLAGFALAQTTAPPTEGEKRQWLQEVIDVKYADTNALAKLLGNMEQGGTPDRVTAQQDLHAISIGTYDPSFLKLAKEIIQRYDVPASASATSHQHGVEIVAHILLAGPKGSSGDALPADLEPVAKQLRSVFGYTDIRLLESSLILGREARESDVSGTLSGLAEGQKAPVIYQIQIRKISVEPGGKGNSIALGDFRFSVRLPYDTGSGKSEYMGFGFNTDLNVLEGQKVVVGKSHIGETKEALILVLSARVVE
jgi:hypothetical protein